MNTVEVQKSMKSISRILHLPSVLRSESVSMQGCVFYVYLRFDLNENNASLPWVWYRRAYAACVWWVISKIERQRGDQLLKKSHYFYFLCIQKAFSSLHNSQIEALMSDGVSWRCFSYFSGPRQCSLLGSRWDRHKPPGFHPKYLKLCSEDELLWSWNDMRVSE